MSETLYERLGAIEGITRVVNDLVDNHMTNPAISNRFAKSDFPALKNAAATFMISATGGPDVYKGKDMLATHNGMNIAATEFNAVLDDALAALTKKIAWVNGSKKRSCLRFTACALKLYWSETERPALAFFLPVLEGWATIPTACLARPLSA